MLVEEIFAESDKNSKQQKIIPQKYLAKGNTILSYSRTMIGACTLAHTHA